MKKTVLLLCASSILGQSLSVSAISPATATKFISIVVSNEDAITNTLPKKIKAAKTAVKTYKKCQGNKNICLAPALKAISEALDAFAKPTLGILDLDTNALTPGLGYAAVSGFVTLLKKGAAKTKTEKAQKLAYIVVYKLIQQLSGAIASLDFLSIALDPNIAKGRGIEPVSLPDDAFDSLDDDLDDL